MKRIIVFSCIIIFILSLSYVYFANVKNDIASSIIRFHIIANSDSYADQQTKIEIRNKLLNKYAFNFSTKEEFENFILSDSDKIKNDIDSWLFEENKDYTSTVSLCRDSFPTKIYGNLMLPKGNYEALKITLGNGKGHNWWCVMFPPLCFVDSSTGVIDEKSKNYLKNQLSSNEYSIITDNNVSLQFKALEIVKYVQKLQ